MRWRLDVMGWRRNFMAYWPYGATRAGGVAQTDKLYTGQQQEAGDAALGLYHYKARLYSTTVGRFVSADPVVQAQTDPLALNRYAYVRDNPLRFVDPSGHCFTFMGQKFSCSNTDAENWITWAMTRNDWVGAIARYGLGLTEILEQRARIGEDNEDAPWKAVRGLRC